MRVSYAWKSNPDPQDIEELDIRTDQGIDRAAMTKICISEMRRESGGTIILELTDGTLRILAASELAWLDLLD